uniref:Stomatin-2 (projected from Caenorhabditis elegans ortholog sto-2) n=1 Tax=Strongyloides venezuelensis TaxID=75913 RepID=A0A0K0FII6_STRVS
MKNNEDRKPFLPSYQHSRPHYLVNEESSSPEISSKPLKPMYRGRNNSKQILSSSPSSSSLSETLTEHTTNLLNHTISNTKKKTKNFNYNNKKLKHLNNKSPQRGNVSFHNVSYKLTNLSEDEDNLSEEEEGSVQSSEEAENNRLMEYSEDEEDPYSNTSKRDQSSSFLNSGIPPPLSSSIKSHSRLTQRRFTLNPLIFAKEERDARRQSLAQLKLSYYPSNAHPDVYDTGHGFCGWFLMILSYIIMLATFPISICFCIKVVQEYERAVIFRLGRLIGGGAKGPGIFFVMPCIESYTKVDLRTVSFNVPPQEILTKDSVTVSVDAVVYYRISQATISVANVENCHHSTRLLAQTTLRNMLGMKNLSDILADREHIASYMQTILDEATESWGIKVERVEIKDVRLPVQLQRAMAAEAEATREARAKVIAAEGEQLASKSLQEAANIISQSPAALQLRYLQTLNSVAAEKNSTIIFPLPIEIIKFFFNTNSSNNNDNKKEISTLPV